MLQQLTKGKRVHWVKVPEKCPTAFPALFELKMCNSKEEAMQHHFTMIYGPEDRHWQIVVEDTGEFMFYEVPLGNEIYICKLK